MVFFCVLALLVCVFTVVVRSSRDLLASLPSEHFVHARNRRHTF
jgi:hypothetical protein